MAYLISYGSYTVDLEAELLNYMRERGKRMPKVKVSKREQNIVDNHTRKFYGKLGRVNKSVKTSRVGRYITSQEITQAQNAAIRGNKRSKKYAVSLLNEASRQIVRDCINAKSCRSFVWDHDIKEFIPPYYINF